jgi:ubiquinone/menaquinone biosynthesis C-methylase UbiE
MSEKSSQNTYFIDAESTAEMGRLMRLDETMTECMGGLFPEHPDLADVHSTLDVACGPGSWASEMAYQYPEMQVVGIDISQTMIRYAEEMARVQRLDNVHFRVMDATKPLEFPDNSFDLVNARLIDGFMTREIWPRAIQEFVRVTRPGGIVRVTEADSWAISNSFALEKLIHLGVRALYQRGHSFSPYPEAQHISLTPMLESFFRAAGCQDIQKKAHVLDFSAGAKGHVGHYENYKVAFKLMQPFFVQAGVATQEELDVLYEQMLAEMLSDNFCALCYLLSVWGRKSQ